jgi:PAS domain S-box-containing protein
VDRTASGGRTVPLRSRRLRGALLLLAGTVTTVIVAAVMASIRGETTIGAVVPVVEPLAYAVAVAVALSRPVTIARDRLAWGWVAAAVTVRAVAIATHLGVLDALLPAPRASVGVALWTVSSVLLLVGAITLATARLPRPSVTGAIDLATFGVALAALVATAGVGLLSGRDLGTSALTTLVALAYPALDVALLVVVAGFLVAWRWRPPLGVAAFSVGAAGVAVADLIALANAIGGDPTPTPLLSAFALLTLAMVAASGPLDDDRDIPSVAARSAADGWTPALLATVTLGLLVAAAIVRSPLVVILGLGAVAVGLILRTALSARELRTFGAVDQALVTAQVGDWHVDARTGTHTWSPTTYAVLGVDPSVEANQELYLSLVHPDDRAHQRATWEEATRTGLLDTRYRIVRPDGEVRVVELHAVLPPPSHGQPLAWSGTLQDVTERVAFEDALQRSEETLQRVLALTNDGWFTEDLRTGETFHSPRWWELHGYVPGDLPEVPGTWRALTHPEDVVASERVFAAALAARVPTWTVRIRALHRDGHAFPILVRGLIEYDDDGPLRVSGVATDLTVAEQAEQAKATFLSSVTHELRTPLTAIGGALETVRAGRAGAVPDEMVQLLELADRNAGRLRSLVDDLLDVGRLRAGQLRISLETLALCPLLAQAVDDQRPYAAQVDVDISFAGCETEIFVHVDPLRLTQVITNYLSNALRFAPRGSSVGVAVKDRDGTVRVEVIDRGPGLPESFVPLAFEPFSRATDGAARDHDGTGLGLAISRELIVQLGGTVGVTSEPGRTSFHLELPTVAAPTAP